MALGAGAIAGTIACANGAAFALSTVLSLGGPASGLNRVFLARAATAAGILASAYLAVELQVDPIEPMMWSLAICAGALTPAYLLAIWWDRMTWISASAGIFCSLAWMAGVAAMAFAGPDMVVMNGDETALQLPLMAGLPLAVTAGLVGIACGLLVSGISAFVPARRIGSVELELLRVPDAHSATREDRGD
jgi:Na+(H+)/acetate symporter ActP